MRIVSGAKKANAGSQYRVIEKSSAQTALPRHHVDQSRDEDDEWKDF
jgi:hypothetical protein